MISAQWTALTDLDPLPHHHPVEPPLKVEGGELRGIKRNDHSVWSVAVMGVMVAVPMTACDYLGDCHVTETWWN